MAVGTCSLFSFNVLWNGAVGPRVATGELSTFGTRKQHIVKVHFQIIQLKNRIVCPASFLSSNLILIQIIDEPRAGLRSHLLHEIVIRFDFGKFIVAAVSEKRAEVRLEEKPVLKGRYSRVGLQLDVVLACF